MKNMVLRASALVAGGVLSVLMAAPALASVGSPPAPTAPVTVQTAQDCKDFLSTWYIVGPQVSAACQVGQAGFHGTCKAMLTNIGVEPVLAGWACSMANSSAERAAAGTAPVTAAALPVTAG